MTYVPKSWNKLVFREISVHEEEWGVHEEGWGIETELRCFREILWVAIHNFTRPIIDGRRKLIAQAMSKWGRDVDGYRKTILQWGCWWTAFSSSLVNDAWVLWLIAFYWSTVKGGRFGVSYHTELVFVQCCFQRVSFHCNVFTVFFFKYRENPIIISLLQLYFHTALILLLRTRELFVRWKLNGNWMRFTFGNFGMNHEKFYSHCTTSPASSPSCVFNYQRRTKSAPWLDLLINSCIDRFQNFLTLCSTSLICICSRELRSVNASSICEGDLVVISQITLS